MAKFTAFSAEPDAKEILIKLIDKYPTLYSHIDPEKIGFVRNLKKKSKIPIKVSNVTYPNSIWNDNIYVFEIFNDCWACLEPKQKNIAVAQAMCALHKDGFQETSNGYAKIIRPDITTYMEIFVLAGGVPNWLENASAIDPLA